MANKRRKRRLARAKASAQLPAAPLVEVVFELRWALQPAPTPPGQFDPGLIQTMQSLVPAMSKLGFDYPADQVHPLQTGPYGVTRRFMRNAESPFPLMQIGAGIFAANEAANYRWTTFKAQILDGIRALLTAYPTKSLGLPITPNYLELRYIDVFTKAITDCTSIVDFANTGTRLRIEPPSFLSDKKLFWGDPRGQVALEYMLRDRKESTFSFQIANGTIPQTNESVIQLLSRVISNGGGVPKLKSPAVFVRDVENWLEFAHGILSPFFRSFVADDVMDKFKRRGA
jgi:uncharacterized protein (TIGR04255 family)